MALELESSNQFSADLQGLENQNRRLRHENDEMKQELSGIAASDQILKKGLGELLALTRELTLETVAEKRPELVALCQTLLDEFISQNDDDSP